MRITVIAREQQDLRVLKTMMPHTDAHVEIVASENQAEISWDQVVQKNRPDIVLIDKNIPLKGQPYIISQENLRIDLTISKQSENNTFQVVPVKKQAQAYKSRFLVKHGQRFLSIDVSQIAFFLSEGRFIFLRTKDNQKYLIEYRIEELEEMLDPKEFFRVNRSFLVAVHAIDQVHVYHGNRLKLLLQPASEKEVIVSRERVQQMRLWLGA